MEYHKLRLKQVVMIIADVTWEWEESENNNKPKHQVPADPADVWKFYEPGVSISLQVFFLKSILKLWAFY